MTSSNLYLIFNHSLTPEQEQHAKNSLMVDEIITMPEDIRGIWSDIPPDIANIGHILEPIKHWLKINAHKGDLVLIQGDFGACYIMVNFAFSLELVPIYSTTQRIATEKIEEHGVVKLTHNFSHRIFRLYSK